MKIRAHLDQHDRGKSGDEPAKAGPSTAAGDELSEAERDEIADACDAALGFGEVWIRFLRNGNESMLLPVVAQIVAARVALVEAERDEAVLFAKVDRNLYDERARADAAEAQVARLTVDVIRERFRLVAAEARAAKAEALVEAGLGLVTDCHMIRFRGSDTTCFDVIGATFPNGVVFTADMACVPCRVRAALGGAK